jgi:hypothetical protein
MPPLGNDLGSIAVIAAVLRQSPEAGSYSAAAAQCFSASPGLAHTSARAAASIRERVVAGAWRDPQPLHSVRYGRIRDRLDVNAVLCEQQIARRLGHATVTIAGGSSSGAREP